MGKRPRREPWSRAVVAAAISLWALPATASAAPSSAADNMGAAWPLRVAGQPSVLARRLSPIVGLVAVVLSLMLPAVALGAWQTSFGPTGSWGLSGVAVAPDRSPVGWSNAGCGEDTRAANAPELAWLSAADGSVRWQLTPADSSPYALMECAGPPLFDNEGNTYVGGYPKGQYPGPSSPTGWSLVSYSRTGAFRWATPIENFQLDFILPDDVIGADGNVYVYIDGYYFGKPSYLHAYRASDGASLWSAEIPSSMSPGVGLYADHSGLIIGGTMHFDYGGHMLQSPGQSSRGTRASPMAQEPGGAIYTASSNKTHCADKKPYYKVTVTRWTLKGEDWKREVRPAAPPASREECEGWVHVAAIQSVPGGGVVVSFQNGGEDSLFRLDDKGHVLWTHTLQPGWNDFPGAVRVTSDGTVVTLQDGREQCDRNRWGECGVVAVNFYDSATGTSNRPTVFIRDAVQSYWSEPPNEPHLQGEFAVGPDAAYLYLALDGEYQVVKLDAPGLGADYREALRVAPGFAPTVTKVAPSRGYWGGGTIVTIKGKHLADASVVRFGSEASPAPPTVLSDTAITAIAPKGPVGTVDVTVTTPGGTSAVSKKDHFLYEPPAEYVALGDSFASGLGSFSYLTGTTKGEHPCYRATKGYVEQLAGVTHDALAFVACQGSSIADSNTNGALIGGATPQLNQLSSATRLITLSIGGIDVGFPQVIASCVEGPLAFGEHGCASRDEPYAKQSLAWLEHRRAVGNHYRLPGIDQGSGQVDYSENTVRVPSLTELYEQIAAEAPHARLLVVGYPHLFGTEGGIAGDECFVEPKSGLYSVAGSDITWLNTEADEVDAIIENAVNAAKAHTNRDIVFADPRAAFTGHGMCDSGSEYLNHLLINIKKQTVELESFHPDVEGQNALAGVLEPYLP
jgi:hypothetical protein